MAPIERSYDEDVTVTGIAYHIDKTCTGGTDEDFIAAEAIRQEFVVPFQAEVERLRERVADLEDERDGLIEELLRAEGEGYASRAATRMEGDRG